MGDVPVDLTGLEPPKCNGMELEGKTWVVDRIGLSSFGEVFESTSGNLSRHKQVRRCDSLFYNLRYIYKEQEPVEPEWKHVWYDISPDAHDHLHGFEGPDGYTLIPSEAPDYHGPMRNHIFDGHEHKDGSHYGQFVMWSDNGGNLYNDPTLENTVCLTPVTAKRVRFRVYKNGLPA